MEIMEKTINDDGTVGDIKVEKIIDRRERNSCVEYLLKQKEKDCYVENKTLVPENNLDYALVSAYENKKKEEKIFKKKKVEKRKRSAMVEKEKIPVRENNMKIVDFNQKFEPEKIVGATKMTGELLFLMKWKSIDEIDLVRANEANEICPQIVIKFYERRLSWRDENKDSGVVEGRTL